MRKEMLTPNLLHCRVQKCTEYLMERFFKSGTLVGTVESDEKYLVWQGLPRRFRSQQFVTTRRMTAEKLKKIVMIIYYCDLICHQQIT
jgi:hypothetical protein